MTKLRLSFRCDECGAAAPQWAGRCSGCGAWNTLTEQRAGPAPGAPAQRGAVRLRDAPLGPHAAWPTGLAELDRVLAGGVSPGSATVLGGEPGIGKSTLALQAAASLAHAGGVALYATGEEPAPQVRRRAERFGPVPEGLWLIESASLEEIEQAAHALNPQLLVIDSVQTVVDGQVGSPAGSVLQVRSAAARLAAGARARGGAVLLIGHVTKDGQLAGPRALEHVVDTVLSFEGDRRHSLRLLRALKHRFGPTGEVGVLEMGERGLCAVADPSRLLLADRRPGVPGSAVGAVVDGRRPLLVELQALVAPAPAPRRSAHGLDAGRLGLLVALLERRAGLSLAQAEVFALAVGGVRVAEPAADLALAVALASAALGEPVPERLVVCGELGLGGEVRSVPDLGRRLHEAARLGFTAALAPASAPAPPPGLELLAVGHLSDALDAVGLRPGPRAARRAA
ncbi:MAG: DNA repair protein RadA [Acidimicrobiales bacterium]